MTLCDLYRRSRWTFLAALCSAALAAATASAQSIGNGTIRGKVVDATGAALPGVAVTATGPALLASKDVVSDAEGAYALPDLPIGEYQVTFALDGFQRLVRQQIQVSAGFSATVNVVLKIGALEETVTVAGASPVVDTSSTTPSVNLSSKFLTEVIPATRNVVEFLSTTPGVIRNTRPDLGGGTSGGGDFSAYGIIGQETIMFDGVNTHQSVISQGTGIGPDMGSLEEMQVVALGGGAEQQTPGIMLNMVVKSGGNVFHGRYEAQGETDRLQADNVPNLPQVQRDFGVSVGDGIRSFKEFSGDLGGPIVKDRIWFYGGGRYQQGDRNALNFAQSPGPDGIYNTADDVPGHRTATLANRTIKGTFQVKPKYKLIGLYSIHTENFDPYPDVTNARFNPFEHSRIFTWDPHEVKLEMQATPTDRLVFNLLLGRHRYLAQYVSQPTTPPGPWTFDQFTQLNLGPNFSQDIRPRLSWGPTASVSYFPAAEFIGKHELKAGVTYYRQWVATGEPDLSPYNYELVFNNGAPQQMITYNYPLDANGNSTHQNEGGAFIQDAWRVSGRLTVNLGLRFDSFTTWIPAESKPAGQFSPAGSFPQVDTGSWRQFAPRLGVALDLTGDAKTVLKASFGHYNHSFGDDFPNPFNRNGTYTTTYRFRDQNNNRLFTPGEVNLDPNGPDFVSTTSAANNFVNLDLRDPFTSEAAITLDRELIPNVAARIGYTYIRQVDLFSLVNTLRPYENFNVPITAKDPGPDGRIGTADDGGNVVVWDYPAQYRGSSFVGNRYVNRPATNDPITNVIEGVITRRTTGNWGMLASMTAYHNHRILTGIPASPNDDYFNVDTTWSWQTKLTGNYDLPWSVRLSGSMEVYNGVRGQRTVTFTGIPSQSTVSLRLEPFGAESGPVRKLVNLRAGRDFILPRKSRIRASLDVLNLMNAANPWAISFVSGSAFGQYTILDSPRIVRAGVTYSF